MPDDLTANGVPVYRDSAGVVRERVGKAELAALTAQVATKADAATIPLPADTMPMAERTGAAIGAQDSRYARADHQHPRLTSTTYASLGSDGTATVAFTRTFTAKPGVNITETDAAGAQPLVCTVQSWVRDGAGAYTGCIIKGYRSTLLPTLAQVSPLALISGVIGAANAVNAGLSNLNIFGGSAAGATVSVIAVARSDVPAT